MHPSVLGCALVGRWQLLDLQRGAQEALKPVNSAARDVVAQLQRLLGQQPDLSFPITAAKAQTWLINTFLDEVRPAHMRVDLIRGFNRSNFHEPSRHTFLGIPRLPSTFCKMGGCCCPYTGHRCANVHGLLKV